VGNSPLPWVGSSNAAEKPQLASRGRVVAVLVWDAVILQLTKLAERGSNSH
jgi:hypothetical protein